MPTYEYQCKACGYRFERMQSITAEPVIKCPVCGMNEVVRLISGGTGLIFKGSGFYITDYKNNSASPAKPAGKPTPAVKENAVKKEEKVKKAD